MATVRISPTWGRSGGGKNGFHKNPRRARAVIKAPSQGPGKKKSGKKCGTGIIWAKIAARGVKTDCATGGTGITRPRKFKTPE